MFAFTGRLWLLIASGLLYCSLGQSSEIEEFEVLSSQDNPMRREFDNHTETCFRMFKSSMVKLAVLFLDPGSESDASQQESKCWIKCMMEQFNFIKIEGANATAPSGEIVSANIMEKANDLTPTTKSRLSQIIEKCEIYARPIEDICSKAFGFAKCIFESYRMKQAVPVVPVVPVKPVMISG